MPRKTKILNISLSKGLYEEIENIAKGESRTKSELIREAFRKYLKFLFFLPSWPPVLQ